MTTRAWEKWGPYVAERSWGTVREDYSADGNAWVYFPHDQARSKAYRWGEDGIAGWCDRYQVLCFSPAFWNGKDPILKERLFGLTAWEGNHGEDVKEIYYYLDGTPDHTYMKYLYKYPQEEFPYSKLMEENGKRSVLEGEYELVDTGIFSEDRYFDIVIEYAKTSPEETCVRIEAFNRGKQDALLHIIPQLWFRNQWSWTEEKKPKPSMEASEGCLIADDTLQSSPSNLAFDYHLGKRYLYGSKGARFLFTENEDGLKAAFHQEIVHKEKQPPKKQGTKACFHYFFEKIPAHGSVVVYLRLSDRQHDNPLDEIEKIFETRRKEAEDFYTQIHPPKATKEEKKVQREALAGILWSKEIYLFDVNLWLQGDKLSAPPPSAHSHIRNQHWKHLNSMRILLMPDKWEYPWFASWDHAFQCLSFALVDKEGAKEQLWLLLFDQFQHPNGQIPAYEWEFSDLNPPVHAWAALRLYQMDGSRDLDFLEKCFHKLLINFAWWVNKVDSSGNNVFEGGFLGLDNITVLDRSLKLPGGVKLQQSDGTGWMAMLCLNLMSIALELSKRNQVYESLATKFFEHYVYIAHAMKQRGNRNYEMWSEKDHFFYDVLTYPDGHFTKFRVRSLVGLIPLYVIETLDEKTLLQFPEFKRNFEWFLKNRKNLVDECVIPVCGDRYILTLMDKERLMHVLKYVWDEEEFRSPFGLRSLSKYHEKNPFVFEDRVVGYEPAEAQSKVKGGNSNWRGPIWMPTSFLLIEALKKFSGAFKEQLFIQVRNEPPVDLDEMAHYFANRMIALFIPDAEGKRPCCGDQFPFQENPIFYEYYNAETGKGLGASHQTGWSALVANLIEEFRR